MSQRRIDREVYDYLNLFGGRCCHLRGRLMISLAACGSSFPALAAGTATSRGATLAARDVPA